MNHQLYECSLLSALVLMLFFGIYFIVAKTPNKPIYSIYIRSRRIMGAALLVLSANYTVHLTCNLRLLHTNAAIFMNLSTYFLSCWLFSSALMTLLDRNYLTVRRFIIHILQWLFFTVVSGVILLLIHDEVYEWTGLLVMAVWFFFYGFHLARRLIITYHQAVSLFDDTHSDYIAAYIHWLSVFTYWAVVYGLGCGLLTFLPDRYVYLWVLSSIPFYIYLYCSYMNYILYYEQVEQILETNDPVKVENLSDEELKTMPSFYDAISVHINKWTEEEGYTHPGLTIEDLSTMLSTNRTYLANYIKSVYKTTFRDFIAQLRIRYAKRMLLEHPELTVNAISEMCGFLSPSNFTKVFKEKEGKSPARWRKEEGVESSVSS